VSRIRGPVIKVASQSKPVSSAFTEESQPFRLVDQHPKLQLYDLTLGSNPLLQAFFHLGQPGPDVFQLLSASRQVAVEVLAQGLLKLTLRFVPDVISLGTAEFFTGLVDPGRGRLQGILPRYSLIIATVHDHTGYILGRQ
jgi:hypothetical protein